MTKVCASYRFNQQQQTLDLEGAKLQCFIACFKSLQSGGPIAQ